MAEQTERGKHAAIVTGAARGIGRAAALRLARDGFDVIACDRRADLLVAMVDEAQGEGLAIEGVRGDVTDEAHIERVVETAVSEGRALRALVNNAAVNTKGSVVNVAREDWDRTLAVNLTAPFLFARMAIPHMARGGGGAIVNISSAQAFVARSRIAAYAASKGALNALTRAMAVDHGRDGIRVNAVCPGAIRTPLIEEAWARNPDLDAETQAARLGVRYPAGRIGTPEDCAALIAFLVSEEAAFITGQCYLVDGGLTALQAVVPEG